MPSGVFIRTKEHNEKIRLSKLGKPRSEEMKRKISETRKRLFKEGKLKTIQTGKTYEEMYGIKKSIELKELARIRKEGRTYEEMYGLEKAKESKKNIQK